MKTISFTILIFILLLFACNSKFDTKILEYYENGKVKLRKVYVNPDDSLNIELIKYYPNGQIEFSGMFQDTVRTGHFQWFYENGKRKQREFYTDNGKLQGFVNGYYESGIRKFEMEYELGEKIWEAVFDSLGYIDYYDFNFKNDKYQVVRYKEKNKNILTAKKSTIFYLEFPNIDNNKVDIFVTNGKIIKKSSELVEYELTPLRSGNLIMRFSIIDRKGDSKLIGVKEFKVK